MFRYLELRVAPLQNLRKGWETMKNNIHKKDYQIDEFDRHYACQNRRLRQLREDKHLEKKKTRNKNKRAEQSYDDDEEFVDEFVEDS